MQLYINPGIAVLGDSQFLMSVKWKYQYLKVIYNCFTCWCEQNGDLNTKRLHSYEICKHWPTPEAVKNYLQYHIQCHIQDLISLICELSEKNPTHFLWTCTALCLLWHKTDTQFYQQMDRTQLETVIIKMIPCTNISRLINVFSMFLNSSNNHATWLVTQVCFHVYFSKHVQNFLYFFQHSPKNAAFFKKIEPKPKQATKKEVNS